MDTELDERLKKVYAILKDKGLHFGEILMVKRAYEDLADTRPRNCEKRPKSDYYSSTIPELSGNGFSNETEVEVYNLLHKLAPDAKKHKLIDTLKIINSLLGVRSEWNFNDNLLPPDEPNK